MDILALLPTCFGRVYVGFIKVTGLLRQPARRTDGDGGGGGGGAGDGGGGHKSVELGPLIDKGAFPHADDPWQIMIVSTKN